MFENLAKGLFAFQYRHRSLVNRLMPSITLNGRRLHVLPSVYKPLDNEHGLVDSLDDGKTVLDMGCGSGVLTVFAALKSEHVTAVDINPDAVENTRSNCSKHQLTNVDIRVSDMFSTVDGRYDYIVSFPPLFRIQFAASHQQWGTSTYFVDELFKGARGYLRQGGRLVVLLPKAYKPSPATLAAKNGLRLLNAVPNRRRPMALRLHSLPYLHVSLNLHVCSFDVPTT